ncbi:MAG: hypothetical protein K5770_19190 [Lachnospiraceae bacterium]|nr:hypothetical protein [Lachnospiraceae bacterium]
MIYRILVDGSEYSIRRQMADHSREADNIMREEIIRHYLDAEGAKEVLILDSTEEGT